MKNYYLKISCIFACLFVFSKMNAQTISMSVVDSLGLKFESDTATSFCCNPNNEGSPQLIQTYNGYQYATYYNNSRYLVLARRKLATNDSWQKIIFTDYNYLAQDTHNTPAIGICTKDGTIHLAFDHHVSPLHYRISQQNVATNPDAVTWNSSLFGPVKDTLVVGSAVTNLTYPAFIPTTAGDLLLVFRIGGSGSGDTYIRKYDGTTHAWVSGLGKFVSGSTGSYTGEYTTTPNTNRSAYPFFAYQSGRLHMAWTWRETAASYQSNHDLMYVYSDDDGVTWKNKSGTLVATTGSTYISLTSPNIIIDTIPQNRDFLNDGSVNASPDGTVLINIKRKLSATGTTQFFIYKGPSATTYWPRYTAPGLGTILRDDEGLLYYVGLDATNHIAVSTSAGVGLAWTLQSTTGNPQSNSIGMDRERWKDERVISLYAADNRPPTLVTPVIQRVRTYYSYSSLLSIADTYVMGGTNADSNQQTIDPNKLLIKNVTTNVSLNRYTFIKLPVTSAHLSPDASVINLKLHVNSAVNQGSITTRTLYVQGTTTSDNWTETGITFNNAPTLGSTLSTITLPAGITNKDIYVDVTSYVKSKTNGYVTFALTEPANEQMLVSIAAREVVGLGPQLVINKDSVHTVGALVVIAPQPLSADKTDSTKKETTEKSIVYPNPASTSLYFNPGKTYLGGNLRIKVIGLYGKLVIDKTIRATEALNISQLSPGNYVVQVSAENKVLDSKMIIVNR
jgi:hypothetical protein